MRYAVLAAAVFVIALFTPAGIIYAQSKPSSPTPDQLIATRQAGFDLQAGAAVAMKTVIEAKLDVTNLEDAANGLASWGHAIPGLFPDGTQTGH